MRVMLSRWENGHSYPDEMYRRMLCSVFEADAAALGLLDPHARPVRSAVVDLPSVSVALIAHLHRSLTELAQLDNQVGSAAALPAAEAQAQMLATLAATKAPGHLRDELLLLGSRFAEFCGWLRQDAGDLSLAHSWSDRALDLAHELGRLDQLSYVLMRKSNLEAEAGRPLRAIGLATAALRERTELSPSLRAVALRQSAWGHAMAGDVRPCLSALEAAQAEVEDGADCDQRTDYVKPAYIRSEAGRCLLELREPVKAERILRSALADWPSGQERDKGHCLARLSSALLQQRQVDEGAVTLKVAVEVARGTSSARLHGEIRRVAGGLATWGKVDTVSEVTNAIRTLR